VYQGQFRVVPVDVVLADVHAQVAAGAQHITFGDPDFFNGPAHARRIVERLAAECPGTTYDVTIKIEHLLAHADMLRVLRDTGCLFVTSAVESIDDVVLEKLRKGHTRADFVRAVSLCRDAGLTLAPTFVPFTPWTTKASYAELLDVLDDLDLVEQAAPIQLAIRLLVTAGSPLLELPDIRAAVSAFDPASLTYPWVHPDPHVDALQRNVMRLVGLSSHASRSETFGRICALAERPERSERSERPERSERSERPERPERPERSERSERPPVLSEPWYCCAEPLETF
jgi:hypothetical protein